MVRVLFRTDAGFDIGTGHVMRCLTLADALAAQGAQCRFLCRPHAGHLIELIRARGHLVQALAPPLSGYTPPQNDVAHAHWLGEDWAADAAQCARTLQGSPVADWLVVDHYALDARWEQALSAHYHKLLIIDDLADRPHIGHLLLDSCYQRKPADYAGLVPFNMPLLLGTEYALLRPEFAALRPQSLTRRQLPQLSRLLISLGGVDKDNITTQLLENLDQCALPAALEITVVMGPKAPWLENVRNRAARMGRPTRVLAGVSDMAGLMLTQDLAIGAAGGSSWERGCLGLPSLMLILADNQRLIAQKLHAAGMTLILETAAAVQAFFARYAAPDAMQKLLQQLSRKSAGLTQGLGAKHVSATMLGGLAHG